MVASFICMGLSTELKKTTTVSIAKHNDPSSPCKAHDCSIKQMDINEDEEDINSFTHTTTNHNSSGLPQIFIRHSRSRSAPTIYNYESMENLKLTVSRIITHKTLQKFDQPNIQTAGLADIQEKIKTKSSHAVSLEYQNNMAEGKELIDEIDFLEEEIAALERSVLALYRGFFNRRLSGSSNFYQKYKPTHSDVNMQVGKTLILDPIRITRDADCLSESIEVAKVPEMHLPQTPKRIKEVLCDMENTIAPSLGRDGPRPLKDYLSESLNQLSENMVHCMKSIYCKLSDPPPTSWNGNPESPSSCNSCSTSVSSMYGVFSDGWSPGSRADSSYDMPMIDPYEVKSGLKCGHIGAYSCMIEIAHICVDKDKLNHAARMLREFRLMIEKLEKVDPSLLNDDEKLAFWINIYNALLMHAYLAYGIPRNNLKRMSLLQKASYKIGGLSINAHTIQHHILRCRSYRPGQWLQTLLLPSSKLRSGDGRRAFTIKRAEPLVCFALSCGGRSDPAVRVYTAKHVHEELEVSMRDFLQASIGFQNNRKVLLPKILEWYMKEASINPTSTLEWIYEYMNNHDRESIQTCIHSKPRKNTSRCIEWVPYNFTFRYIVDHDPATRFCSRTIQ